MPIAPKKPCSQPGCGKLVAGGKCDCGRVKPREVDTRVSSSKRGYDRAWRRVRGAFLKKHPLCVFCAEQGITKAAEEVDHIKPISQGGERLKWDNLRPLCKSCHSKHTVATGGGFGRPRSVGGGGQKSTTSLP